MGDVISTHLDETKREMITARTGEVMGEFGRLYEQQYALALVNSLRFEIEANEGPQLLHRKVPLKDKSIFSGALFQYLEENKKWRNRFFFVPDTYQIQYFDNKMAYERGLHPKATINCAGYRVLTSMDQYMELLSNSLPGVNAKASSSPFLKCAKQFTLILWHPYARHFYFCVTSEKEQEKWHAVFQDCVRHTNDGLSEECKVQTPAFTDAVRLYRQAHGQYGTWDMMCGMPPQILANLVMETLLPELRGLIAPRLKGKLQDRQRNWMLISDAVYGLVQGQTEAQYEAIVQRCEAGRPPLETSIRTDMDQIITSKEHVTNKMRALVLPKAEELLKDSVRPFISSILEALMEPTSRGFSEVRDVFFRELVDMSKNSLNDGSKEKLGEHMEKISMLAFHPVKMQSCYEKVEQLQLEGLQQRFDVSSPSVFVQRAQILMREQMDDAVYTFEKILHQSLEDQGSSELCKTIQRCQDRVIKKYDYDSSTVRKKFFREALLQILIPYMLKQLSPDCAADLPQFEELIFEDFSRYILVENVFEEVVLQSVMKDIMLAVKEAAVQRRHNLYRDSIVLTNSDPNLHLLGEKSPIDWAGQYGGEGKEEEEEEGEEEGNAEGATTQKRRRVKQVVSMIQIDGAPFLPYESCLEVPGVDGIPEESEVDLKSDSVPETGPPTPALPNGTAVPESVDDKAAPPIVAEVQSPAPTEKAPQEAEAEHPVESPKQETESKTPAESVEQEIKPPTENAEQEVESKPAAENAEQGIESKPATENAEQEVESKPATENAEQQVESKPATENAELEVESKPATGNAEQEVEGKPATESAEQEVEGKTQTESAAPETKPPTESLEPKIESKPSTESVEQEVESIPPTESAEQAVECKAPTESAEQEVECKAPTESAEQEIESKAPTESAEQEVESKAPTESAEQEVENTMPTESTEQTVDSNQPADIAAQEVENKQPTEHSQQDTESSSAVESAIPEIDKAVQGEESGQPSESTEKDVAKTAAPKQEEEVPSTGTAETASKMPPEPAQQDASSAPDRHDDSGFQSPTSDVAEEEDAQRMTEALADSGKGGVAVEAVQSNLQTGVEAS
ncbi:protein Niban 2b [Conger conger]|uniref:protein Niban 2b n=1 Tax=Conger conger TaxID=82655 RepID=UPI002A5A9129|nr:protein Niban 2b [Conger conger]